jgi:hypothetical protein
MLNHFSGPCFFFDINQIQNGRLQALEATLGPDALVRYASPCFTTFAQSDAAFAAGLVAQRSHFAAPVTMVGHTIYGYVSPVQLGQGFSVPESVNPASFLGDLNRLISKTKPMSFAKHLLATWTRLSATNALEEKITAGDIETAAEALGDGADVPLDPLEMLDPETTSALTDLSNITVSKRQARGGLGRYSAPSLMAYATILMAVERVCRRELKTTWLVFHEPVVE